MKKLFIAFTAIALAASLFTGCKNEPAWDEDITITTDKIELSDGTWKINASYSSSDGNEAQTRSAEIVISDNSTKIKIMKFYDSESGIFPEGTPESEIEDYKARGYKINGNQYTYSHTYTQEELDEMNETAEISYFTGTDSDTIIKTNEGKTKYKAVLVKHGRTTTGTWEKL